MSAISFHTGPRSFCCGPALARILWGQLSSVSITALGEREYSKNQVLKGEGCVVSRLYSLPFRQAVCGVAASPVLRLPLIEMNSFMNGSLSSVFSGLLAFRFCNWVLLVNFPYTYGLPPKIDFKVFENRVIKDMAVPPLFPNSYLQTECS